MIASFRFASILALVFGFASSNALAQTSLGDRELALHALADMQAATDAIVATEDGNAVGKVAYKAAALRARNAIIGRRDRDYVAKVGDPGDGVGAIGYIDRLLDRSATESWTNGLRGAKINLLAAAQGLTDALGVKQMEDYETDLTAGLADISLAQGRPSQAGVLGGIEGALATTSLGVPSGAKIVSACSISNQTPAYGVTSGTLAYLALDRHVASSSIPRGFPVDRVAVVGNRVILYTQTASQIARICGRRTAAIDVAPAGRPARAHRERTRAVAKHVVAGASAGAVAFTAAQAHAGAAVYAQNCTSCHGANLQGVAGPAVAGKAFLTQVQGDGWSVADLRNLVVQQMPLNNPGTLKPKQYADVIAFLLASNCYKAGSKAFAQNEDVSLAKVKIRHPLGARPTDAKLGICKVR